MAMQFHLSRMMTSSRELPHAAVPCRERQVVSAQNVVDQFRHLIASAQNVALLSLTLFSIFESLHA